MVQSKNARGAGRNAAAPKNNNRRKERERESVQSKQDLLAALTRQAEVNTRILERERAAVLAMEIQTVESLHPAGRARGGVGAAGGGGGGGANAHHAPRNKAAPRPLDIGRPPKAPGGGGNGRAHMFLDGGHQKKVLDPSQVPGLMGPSPGAAGGRGAAAWSPFAGAGHMDAGGASFSGMGRDALEGTFPDSPGFYPGMVFGVPQSQAMTPPQQHTPGADGDSTLGPMPPPMMQQQQPLQQPAHGRRSGRGPNEQQQTTMGFPPGGPQEQDGRRGRGRAAMDGQLGSPGPQGNWGQQQPPGSWAPFPAPPSPQQQQWGGGGGWGGPGGGGDQQASRREEQAMRRRELDEQVRAKQQAKEAEKAALRRQEEREDARALADGPWGGPGAGPGPHSPGAWQPQQPPSMYGGGGDPRERRGGPQAGSTLTVQIPGLEGGQGPWFNGPPPGPFGPQGGPPPGPYGQQGPPAWAPSSPGAQGGPWGAPSPGAGSPGPGGRKFMAGLQELRPGPSDEQRRHKETARLKLQADLEEQIRQKREREARARAEEAAARAKEEAEMQAYYRQMQAQSEAEQRERSRKQQPQDDGPQQMGSLSPPPLAYQASMPPPPWQQQQPAQQQQPPWLQQQAMPPAPVPQPSLPPPPAPEPFVHQIGGWRRGKKVIEADWLDRIAAPPPVAVPEQHQHQQPPQQVVAGGMRSVRGSAEGPLLGGAGGSVSPGPGPSGAVATSNANMKGEISALLHELQREQIRLREEFVRQAEMVQNIVQGGGSPSGASQKDKAYQDLNRIRKRLSESEEEMAAALATGAAAGPGDSLDQFVVSTHLVPRNVNAIPSRLATPLEAEWVQAAMRDQAGGPGPGPGQGRFSPEPSQFLTPRGAAAHHGVHGLPLHDIPDEDERFLDRLDQLLGEPDSQQQFWEQLSSPASLQYARGGGRASGIPTGAALFGQGTQYEDPQERGLYRPISQLAGPPSLIPRAPRGGPVGHGGGQRSRAAAGPPPPRQLDSRMAGSFFGPAQQQQPAHYPQQQHPQQRQQQRVQSGRQQGRAAIEEMPILRADHLPSPARRERDKKAGPTGASRFASGKAAGRPAAEPAAAAGPKAGRRSGKPPPAPSPQSLPAAPPKSQTPPPLFAPSLPPLVPSRPSSSSGVVHRARAASADSRLEAGESIGALVAGGLPVIHTVVSR